LQLNQPAKKYKLVVHSDCRGNVANMRAAGLCFLEQSPATYMSTAAKVSLMSLPVHNNKEES